MQIIACAGLAFAGISSCSKPAPFSNEVFQSIDGRKAIKFVSGDELELRKEAGNFVCKYTKEGNTLRVTGNIMGTSLAFYFDVIPGGLRQDDGTIFYSPTALATQRGPIWTTTAAADLQSVRTSLLSYAGMNGSYPTTEQGLNALVMKPVSEPVPRLWRRLMDEVPRDPWGTDFIYRNPGKKSADRYDIFSAGPDRISDTADDDWGGN